MAIPSSQKNNSTNASDVFARNRYDLATAVKKSRAWFMQEVALMTKQGITPLKVLKSGNPSDSKNNIMPGKLYIYLYDPKHKATLPYYDMFPLVFPFRKMPDGFMGLNMHYLPYPLRIRLLDVLMNFKNNDKLDETTRLKYSWAAIDGVSRYAAAKPCVKHYLGEHVKSKFREIQASDWTTAMMLPVERFVGASNAKVWAESKIRIG